MSALLPAVIYARVSSKKQKTEGSGIGSQITRCTEYAKFRGLSVIDIFTDDMTGRVAERPGMSAVLSCVRKHRKDGIVVIIDDISRLARDVDAHRALRKAIQEAGGVLESPTLEFGDGSDATLIENLLASVAQHQSQKNSEQVVNRMRSRMLGGFAVFHPPPGYRWAKHQGGGKIMVPDGDVAYVVRDGLEGFASGKFGTQAAVRRYWEEHPLYPSPTGRLSASSITEQLKNPLYAGYIEYAPWDVALRPAQHEALISYATHLKILKRLEEGSYAPCRVDTSPDFPLRGFVTCGDCGAPLRGCWSKGRNRHYPYYLCQTKGCESYGKSLRRDDVEGAFETLLKTLQPSRVLLETIVEMMKDIWAQRGASSGALKRAINAELTKVETHIKQLIDRVVATESDTLIRAYEEKLTDLERRKAELRAKLTAQSVSQQNSFEVTTRTAIAFLSNPWNLWKSGGIEEKIATIKLTFNGPLPYHRKQGYRTADMSNLSMPFKA